MRNDATAKRGPVFGDRALDPSRSRVKIPKHSHFVRPELSEEEPKRRMLSILVVQSPGQQAGPHLCQLGLGGGGRASDHVREHTRIRFAYGLPHVLDDLGEPVQRLHGSASAIPIDLLLKPGARRVCWWSKHSSYQAYRADGASTGCMTLQVSR